MQRGLKLTLSTLLKVYDVKYTEDSKNITSYNKFILHSVQLFTVYVVSVVIVFLWNFSKEETGLLVAQGNLSQFQSIYLN